MTHLQTNSNSKSETLFTRASQHSHRVALITGNKTTSYDELTKLSDMVAKKLLSILNTEDLNESRIAYLAPPSLDHVLIQWGIWKAGGVAVPLAVSHPPAELCHALEDSDPSCVIVDSVYRGKIQEAITSDLPVIDSSELVGGNFNVDSSKTKLPSVTSGRRAMMIYTSGTTGKPKGAVVTHEILSAQITSLVEAWEWKKDDQIMLVLPLHHIHGIVNILCCALWTGASCHISPHFDPLDTWNHLSKGNLTLFMAVPTVYILLIKTWEAAEPEDRLRWSNGASALRLMVSGSAALPAAALERWKVITGQVLLERYGMTEIGMALSNPLHGDRRPGYVGVPLPRVKIRRVDEDGAELGENSTKEGELEVAGPNVFLEYWRNPTMTESSFRNGWFRTGDIAVVDRGDYRLLGRTSVDIIKTGGFKVSALEIEEVVRQHPQVADCAVVGIPDDDWGELIAVAIIKESSAKIEPSVMITWARKYLASYKIPREFRFVTKLPRNAMGKVQKKQIKLLFLDSSET
ncbi:MAG: acyl-CoA synthetase [Longimicrobiales bacterium]|nr:acyl-CoA synthetase [Longimicrobiales bacterium]